MKYLNKLDEILLSDNVVNEFFEAYSNSDFKHWLLNLLPEVEDCFNQQQDNPWHIYNCLEHILNSVENINKQSIGLCINNRRVLAYTMFFHDMGKPQCHIRRFSKMYGREVDSFFNHNKASVKIARRVLKQFGFDNSDANLILKFVEDHDMFMFLTLNNNGNPHHKVLTDNVVKDKIAELNNFGDGVELLKKLIMIGRADNLSQNPKMTGDSLKLLNKMEDIINNYIKMNENQN